MKRCPTAYRSRHTHLHVHSGGARLGQEFDKAPGPAALRAHSVALFVESINQRTRITAGRPSMAGTGKRRCGAGHGRRTCGETPRRRPCIA